MVSMSVSQSKRFELSSIQRRKVSRDSNGMIVFIPFHCRTAVNHHSAIVYITRKSKLAWFGRSSNNSQLIHYVKVQAKSHLLSLAAFCLESISLLIISRILTKVNHSAIILPYSRRCLSQSLGDALPGKYLPSCERPCLTRLTRAPEKRRGRTINGRQKVRTDQRCA